MKKVLLVKNILIKKAAQRDNFHYGLGIWFEDKKEKYDNKTKEISIKEIDKNSLIAKVNYEIAKLEAKNKKRMHSISVLSHKQKRQQLSIDEEIALTNNKKYLLEDTMMLKKLQFELEDLISIDET